MYKTDSFFGNKKLSLNQNVWHDHVTMQKYILTLPHCILCTGIPRFMLLTWTHKKNLGKRKPHKSRLLSSTKGEENRIELGTALN